MKRLVRLLFAAIALSAVAVAVALAFVDLSPPLRVIEQPVSIDGLTTR